MKIEKQIEYIIYIAILMAMLRGIYVFDFGVSAADSFPVASAICYVGAIMCGIFMFYIKTKK